MKRIQKFLALVLAMAMSMALVSPTAWAASLADTEGEQEAAVTASKEDTAEQTDETDTEQTQEDTAAAPTEDTSAEAEVSSAEPTETPTEESKVEPAAEKPAEEEPTEEPAEETSSAEEELQPEASDNSCGANLTWEIYQGELILSGSGAMENYTASSRAPWSEQAEEITSVLFDGSVTSIGSYAFYGCKNLTAITIPASVESVGNYAFRNAGVTSITFEGDAPDLSTNAFYSLTAVVTYPAGNDTWKSVRGNDFGGTITWKASGQIDLSDCTVTLAKTSAVYTGSAIKPKVTVQYDGEALTEGTDYTVSYADNVNVGTATVTVTGTGDCVGTVSLSFTITGLSLSEATVTPEYTKTTYNGKAKKPSVTVTLNGKTVSDSNYAVSYKNNTNAGTATVTVKGKGNYTGSKSVSFTIKRRSITKAAATLSAESYVYTGKSQKPTVTVKDSKTTLTKDTDYTASYKNNKKIGTATITLTGKGNYTGTQTLNFSIVPAAPKLTKAEKVSSGVKLTWKKVSGATSYQVYRKGSSDSKYKKIATMKKYLTYTDESVKSGTYSYCVLAVANNMVSADSNVKKITLSGLTAPTLTVSNYEGAKLSWTASEGADGYYVYRKAEGGKWKKIASLESSKTSYTDSSVRKAQGKVYFYKVTAYNEDSSVSSGAKTFVRLYTATLTVSLPAKKTAGQVNLSWTAVSSVTGYEIQYSTSSSYKSSEKVTAKASATSATLKKLKSGKKYYIRIRTYKAYDGKKYYSSWGTSRTITPY